MSIYTPVEYFYYDGCTDVPINSTDVHIQSRWSYSDGCSIAEIEGYVMLGGTDGSVHRWDKYEWVEETNRVESGAALGVYEGKVIAVGGMTNDGFSKSVMVQEEKDKEWTLMPEMEMPFGCAYSSVVSVVGGGLLVLGWEEYKLVPSVLVFDVDSKTWHIGSQIPSNGVIVRPFRFEETPKRETPFQYVSAVIYGDLVFTLINATVETEVWYAKISDLVSKLYCTCCVYSNCNVVVHTVCVDMHMSTCACVHNVLLMCYLCSLFIIGVCTHSLEH